MPPQKPAALAAPPARKTKPTLLVKPKFCGTCGARQPAQTPRYCPQCGERSVALAEVEDAAVLKLQAGFRGMAARRRVADLKASQKQSAPPKGATNGGSDRSNMSNLFGAGYSDAVEENDSEDKNESKNTDVGGAGRDAPDSESEDDDDDDDDDDDSDIDEEAAVAAYMAEAQKELEAATVKIQSAFRGSKARAQVRSMRASQDSTPL